MSGESRRGKRGADIELNGFPLKRKNFHVQRQPLLFVLEFNRQGSAMSKNCVV